ncbi:hypothetical protein HY440_03065 [Candidatus Microgenomates bacterium]|nr:hypothetical protein [Candidatus Microgenomates bacterium]
MTEAETKLKILAIEQQKAERNLKAVNRVQVINRPNWVDDLQTPQTMIDEWYAKMAAQNIRVI